MTRYLTLLFLLAPALLACDQLNRQKPPVVPPPAVEAPPAGFKILLRDESPYYSPRGDCLEGDAFDYLTHWFGEEPGYYAYSAGEIDQRSSDVVLSGYEQTGEGWTGVPCVYLKPNISVYNYFKRTPDPAEDWFVIKRNIETTPQPDGTYRVGFGPATLYRVPTSEAGVYFTDELDEKGKPKLQRKRLGPAALPHGPYCLQAGARWFLGKPNNINDPHGTYWVPSPPTPPAAYLPVIAGRSGSVRVLIDGYYIDGTSTGAGLYYGLAPREHPYEVVILETTNISGFHSYITWGLVRVRQGEDGQLVCDEVDWKWIEMPYVTRANLPKYLKNEAGRYYDPFSWENGIPPWQR